MESDTFFHDGFYFFESDTDQTEEETPTRIVWFADEDKTTKRNLEEVQFVYCTSDGLPPQEDGGNILEGNEARNAFREERCAKDLIPTWDLTTRLFTEPISNGGCGGSWKNLQEKLDQLEEPCWCLIGLCWRTLYGNEKRIEEMILEIDTERKAAIKIQAFFKKLFKKEKDGLQNLQEKQKNIKKRVMLLVYVVSLIISINFRMLNKDSCVFGIDKNIKKIYINTQCNE